MSQRWYWNPVVTCPEHRNLAPQFCVFCRLRESTDLARALFYGTYRDSEEHQALLFRFPWLNPLDKDGSNVPDPPPPAGLPDGSPHAVPLQDEQSNPKD